jgi:hypothetical protein
MTILRFRMASTARSRSARSPRYGEKREEKSSVVFSS